MQAPRTIRSISAPACAAATSASIRATSVSALILTTIRAVRPAAAASATIDTWASICLCRVNGACSSVLSGRRPAQARELLEDGVDVAGQLGVVGEVAEVGVETRRVRVVVAGREVRVALQAAVLAPGHEEQLGVRLQADDAVDDLRADLLEALGPVDVGLLVEARLQLDHGHHFLAAPGRLDQQVHQRRDAAGAIDRLLDRQHVRVVAPPRAGTGSPARTIRTAGAGAASPLRMRSNIGCWRGSVGGQAGSKRGKRSVGASARSMSSVMRTRLTGPLTLNSDDSARPNCWSRNADSSAGQVLTTSRRTAWPKCRVVSPERSAWRRLVTSASTSRSESRVIRNCEKASTSRPGKQRAEVGPDDARQQHERLARCARSTAAA